MKKPITLSYDWRDVTPYGVWTCANGRQVMFNRHYNAMWQRTADGKVSKADPREWVECITHHQWLYNDGTPSKERNRRCHAALLEWGIA
jgi:hypothetical protein